MTDEPRPSNPTEPTEPQPQPSNPDLHFIPGVYVGSTYPSDEHLLRMIADLLTCAHNHSFMVVQDESMIYMTKVARDCMTKASVAENPILRSWLRSIKVSKELGFMPAANGPEQRPALRCGACMANHAPNPKLAVTVLQGTAYCPAHLDQKIKLIRTQKSEVW